MPTWALSLSHNFAASLWMEALHCIVSGGVLWMVHKILLAVRAGAREIRELIDARILQAARPIAEEVALLRKDFAAHDAKDDRRFDAQPALIAAEVARVLSLRAVPAVAGS